MRYLSTLVRIILLSFIVFLAGVLMVKSSLGDSPISQEPANLAAGYGYIRLLDYRLGVEQPPLGKALSAVPLLFQKLTFPIASLNWQRDINSSQAVGRQFLYESGNSPSQMINARRIVPIIFTLLLILAIYWTSKELIGKWWALLPAFLFAFFPTALAYGHYATTSAASTLAIFGAVISFLWFLNQPSKRKMLWAAVAFGLAQLTTFAALILIPYFLIILTIFYLASVTRDYRMTDPRERLRRFGLRAFRYFRSLMVIFTIGFLLVFSIYLLFTLSYPLEKQQSDTTFILDQFQPQWLGDFVTQISGTPVLRAAAHYLLGITLNWPVESNSAEGSLLISAGLKTPIALLLLILISLVFSLMNIGKALWSMLRRRTKNFSDYLNTDFTEFAMLIFTGTYWAGSLALGATGLEKILPTLPFLFILISNGIRKWSAGTELANARNLVIKIFLVYEEFLQLSLKSAALIILVVAYFITPLITYPHFLSFSNLLAGGTKNGHRHLTDSDYDLGQDLIRLKTWTVANLPEFDKIAVDYSGGGDIKIIALAEEWESAKGDPINDGIRWLAISATTLANAKKSANAEDQYIWLTASASWRIYARAGTSIFIYKLVE
ncbi:MAG: glycosyltransferase family 39 protein [bacterium]|nr:glycosyltransferase family 39 protein [bacterium]